MSWVLYAIVGWLALNVAFAVAWSLLLRRARERDEILRRAYEDLSGYVRQRDVDAMPPAGEINRGRPRQAREIFPLEEPPPRPPPTGGT